MSKRGLIYEYKRPCNVLGTRSVHDSLQKETYYRSKRDLLYEQKITVELTSENLFLPSYTAKAWKPQPAMRVVCVGGGGIGGGQCGLCMCAWGGWYGGGGRRGRCG
jgi:hypothetical protein